MTTTSPISHPLAIAELQPLLQNAVRFSFFEALRVIENASADLPRVGHATSPSQERFHIRQPADLSFAPSTLVGAELEHPVNANRQESPTEPAKIALQQRFFGLLGPSGPLPIHITEIVRNRDRHADDDALQAFLDIFHHRMSAIFFRAWSSSRATVQRDRPLQDRFAQYLRSLSGNGWRIPPRHDPLGQEFSAYFAGHLGSIRRNAEGLEAILSELSGARTTVKPFALRWLRLASTEQTCLVSKVNSFKSKMTSNCLGRTAVLGGRVPDRQGSFEVRLGPMTFTQFQSLLPKAPNQLRLHSAVLSHSGLGVDAVFRPILKKEEIPPTLLGRAGQLGRTVWLQSKPIESDRDDYTFPLVKNVQRSEPLPPGGRS